LSSVAQASCLPVRHDLSTSIVKLLKHQTFKPTEPNTIEILPSTQTLTDFAR
jgi:hypothetical protein